MKEVEEFEVAVNAVLDAAKCFVDDPSKVNKKDLISAVRAWDSASEKLMKKEKL